MLAIRAKELAPVPRLRDLDDNWVDLQSYADRHVGYYLESALRLLYKDVAGTQKYGVTEKNGRRFSLSRRERPRKIGALGSFSNRFRQSSALMVAPSAPTPSALLVATVVQDCHRRRPKTPL